MLVASTGVIGQRLPVDRILEGLPRAAAGLSRSGGAAAAEAILTTDLRKKECARTVSTPRGAYTIGGMAKGSGMIHPNMATTLGFVATDAAIAPERLQACLRRATDQSFNRISVDGDTSTNDMIAALANGASGVRVEGARETSRFEARPHRGSDRAGDHGRARRRRRDRSSSRSTSAAPPPEEAALRVARTIAGSALVRTAALTARTRTGDGSSPRRGAPAPRSIRRASRSPSGTSSS
jgi:N-acetylglutamate synthase/N-acetylornithine aminotransferase